ncbi:helix-turn-helix domain-containing protein [Pacificispira sp.]|uniref:helix-turn-helix domain-containing protein n=1 Tax=Pacificispira sp. TaxID=2888761 RepID=UPI002EB51A35|nr:helix-turn-helix transcriptional regulator [Pseudomonadota bacterium]
MTMPDHHRIDSAEAFGALMKTRRKAQGISQAMLASITGIPQPNLSKIENGRSVATLETCLRLCATLGIDLVGISRR